MRAVFLGTPEFAVPSLAALTSAGHDVLAVFTQPDRPKGRGRELAESPVKRAAKDMHLPVHQPSRIRTPENVELLRNLDADMMVVVGYGQIIPQSIIDLPKHGILNVHASLLPKYRGAAPIQWAIANGERTTGITIMQIDAGLDTGDMLLKQQIDIAPDDTAVELSVRLAPVGADLLMETIRRIEGGTMVRERQDEGEASYAPILDKADGRIHWNRTARDTYNRLRGFQPWPGAYTTFRDQQLSILAARPADYPWLGTGVAHDEGKRLFVGCGGESTLQILELQIAGKKPISAEAFVNGYKLRTGERLGSTQ